MLPLGLVGTVLEISLCQLKYWVILEGFYKGSLFY